jgi:hypothetical protein
MTSAAIRLLGGECVVLDEYSKTTSQFFTALPVTLVAAAIFWFLVTALVSIAWSNAFDVLLNPFAFAAAFIVFAVADWRSRGARHVCADPKKREIVVVSAVRGGRPETRSVSFGKALLLRHWRQDSDDASAAFVIRLLPSKTFHRADLAGYVLHVEPVTDSVELAEQVTSALCVKLSASLGMEYIDARYPA